jgi:hypothetical protein
MPIPFRLDYVIAKSLANDNGRRERRTIKELAGVRLSVDEARAVWPRIIDHKWYISERLGRDVGLRVATIDYFDNIQRVPTVYRAHDTLPAPLPFMQPLRQLRI